LFVPPEPVQPMYFVVWFLLMYLFLTMAEIPYMAWQAEITRYYQTRSKVVAIRLSFSCAGGFLFALSPLLPIFGSNEMTPAVLKVLAYLIAVLLPIAVFVCVVFAPQGKPVTQETNKTKGTIPTILRDLVRNKPLVIFVIAYMFTGLGAGMQVGLGFLYFDTYLGLGNKFPVILLSMSIAQLLSIPVWLRLMNKVGKHRAFAVGRILALIASILLLFVKPGLSFFPIFMVIWSIMIFMFGAQMVIPQAMMGDIIDYDILKSGHNRSGLYNAVYLLITKINVGMGGGIAFYLVDIFGYDAAATTHSYSSVIGIWITMVVLPAIFFFISAVIMWWFPINEHKQNIIRRRIEMRTQRANKKLQKNN